MSRSPRRSLDNRVVIVTGGSSGLGLAFAHRAASAGAVLWLLARDPRKLDAAREQICASVDGVRVETLSVDINDAAAVHDAIKEIGAIDVLVASAGILTEGRFDEQDQSEWRSMVETNVFGTVNCVHAALPALRESRGQIVIVSSMSGLLGVYGYTAYCASKHALIGFAESLRFEVERDGISVNLICPGEFDSPMVDRLDAQRSPENRAHVQAVPKSPVEQVADAMIAAVERDREIVVPGFRASVASKLAVIFPSLTRRVGMSAINKASRRPKAGSSADRRPGR